MTPHAWIVLATVAAGMTLVLYARRLQRIQDDRLVRYALAFILIANALVAWVWFQRQGYMVLPLQLCDLALFLMCWSLWRRGRCVTELAFFWGLAASTQAILTPDLTAPFPSLPWITFFVGHCGVVLGAIYLSARGYVRTTHASIWRVWLWTNVYAAIVGIVNWQLGTNFGYLAAKPAQPSLLDYLGPWPVYILWCELIALALFYLCHRLNRGMSRH